MKKFMIMYILFIAVGLLYSYITRTDSVSLPINCKNITVDPGHGGYDPGKVAYDGAEEKDVNLSIATLLAGYMRQGGANVSLTRTGDTALSDNKRDDLKLRAAYASGTSTDIFISIHQNSFQEESAHGAQVFYMKNSESGKALAICIQKRLKEVADPGNTRTPKADCSYYVLKNTKAPSVIVECGFLSNPDEHDKLLDSEYQEHLAWAIYMGVLDYYGEGNI